MEARAREALLCAVPMVCGLCSRRSTSTTGWHVGRAAPLVSLGPCGELFSITALIVLSFILDQKRHTCLPTQVPHPSTPLHHYRPLMMKSALLYICDSFMDRKLRSCEPMTWNSAVLWFTVTLLHVASFLWSPSSLYASEVFRNFVSLEKYVITFLFQDLIRGWCTCLSMCVFLCMHAY